MGYDFYSFRVPAGEDPMTIADRLLGEDEGELAPHASSPEIEAKKEAMANAILEKNPQMTRFQLRHDEIAKMENTSIDEARRKYRYIEINPPDDGNGVQVHLYDAYATVSVPYWHQGEQAAAVFREIWGHLETLGREGGYETYDPQLGRVLDLERDFSLVVQCYVEAVQQVQAASDDAGKPEKPWWKFW
jgi:hypothetical protein